jgi:hypothetical protein
MKNCITILSRSDLGTLTQLKHTLDSLHEKYINAFPCDVVIFVESDFPKAFIEKAKTTYKSIIFKEIEFKAPDFLTSENLNFKDPTGLPLSYRNMCRFYTVEFFKHLSDYDFYLRLDVDSNILSKINFDVFKYLKDNNKRYGYIAEILEHPPVVKHLAKYITLYKDKFNVEDKFLPFLLDKDGEYNYHQIYNNFEICDLSLFKEEQVQKFINNIDRSGYIYEYRWGDAPIRTFMLSLFVDRGQIHRFTNIDYSHQGFKQENGIIECEYIPEEWIKEKKFIG